MHGNEKICM
jgi:hypothetical protein